MKVSMILNKYSHFINQNCGVFIRLKIIMMNSTSNDSDQRSVSIIVLYSVKWL